MISLQDVLSNPGDVVTESVYADSLEEQGLDSRPWRESLTTDRIETLPDHAKALTPAWRDYWLEIGLQTGSCDREQAQFWAGKAYQEVGLDSPTVFVWLDSPLQGCIGAYLLTQIEEQVGYLVGDQVEEQIWNQVSYQIWNQIKEQVWDQVREQVWDQVWDQVGNQVGKQIWNQIWNQVSYQVWNQVSNQIWNQITYQIWNQIKDQVWDQVWDQVREQVREQVSNQVGYQVGDQIWDQIRAQTYKACYGNHDVGWLSFYSFMLQALRVEPARKLIPLMNLAHHTNWFWPFQGLVLFTERPTELVMKDKKLVKIQYKDGWGVEK